MEYRPFVFKIAAETMGVCQVPVVGYCYGPLGIICSEGLAVFYPGASCCGVPYMSYCSISVYVGKTVLAKRFVDQSHPLLDVDSTVLYPCHARRKLSPVLKRTETKIDILKHRGAAHAVSAENA